MSTRARGAAALGALVAAIVGVPVLLVRLVGNPWPGWERLELGDEQALVVGVLTALAWLLWVRFVLAVVMAVPDQLVELRAERERPPHAPVQVAAPSHPRAGIGLMATRLVAAALVLLPLGARAVPAAGAPPLAAVATVTASSSVVTNPPAVAPIGSAAAGAVAVADGDTLVGLARRHLGDGDRWREIFELNRDRPQRDGAALKRPSALQAGWTLVLPDGARTAADPPPPPPPAAGAETVTVAEDDTLWDLAHDHLEEAGLAHDDASTAEYLTEVVAVNVDVVEDPDLIHPGEQVELPAVGEVLAPAAAAPLTVVPPEPPAVAAPAPVVTGPASAPAVVDDVAVPPASDLVPAPTTAPAPAAATSSSEPPLPVDGDPVGATETPVPAPFPVGLGEAAVLSAGVLALVAARRRSRLRSSAPRVRVPEPTPEQVATERSLRSIDAGERLLRVDVAIRAAASSLLDTDARPAVVRVGSDGMIELILTTAATLPAPWREEHGRWVLPGTIPVELLAEAARAVGAPCLAVTQLGTDDEGREVLVDLEALGVLTVHAPDEEAAAVLRGIAATLATSAFADVVGLVGVDVDALAFLGHRLAHRADTVDDAVELATTLIGTTASARQSTFVLRARHTSGEAWEPAVVLVGPDAALEVTPELVTSVADRRGGLALVAAGDVPDGAWTLRVDAGSWRLDPLGLVLTPVGLTADELSAVHDVVRETSAPLAVDEPPAVVPRPEPEPDPADAEPPWSLVVRLLGPVDVVDGDGHPVHFERSKTLELVAWLTMHRDRSTRAAARTALWELDVRDATFANVVSEARRAMARHVAPPPGEEWVARTLTERLPLHPLVVSDADLVRARLARARLEPPQQAIETLRPAVAMIRDVPFAGTGYLWPDPEGIASNLVLLATSAAAELAAHLLSIGDVDGVFWATGQGLRVLPGHEELIGLRMRAHHRAGDLSGVRLEWESYERVLDADPWSDGEPAEKLVVLRRELLSGTPAP